MPRSGPLSGRGFNQDELCDLLVLLRTNMLALATALDADDGVGSTTYVSTLTFDLPARFSDGYIWHQGKLMEVLQNLTTKWNAMLAIADADATLTDTDYESACGILDTVNDRSAGDLIDAGVYDGAVAKWLDTAIDQFNAGLAKFDADLGDTAYVTAYGITAATYVNDSGARILIS